MRTVLKTHGLEEKIDRILNKDYRETFFERIQYLLESEDNFSNLPYPLRYGSTLNYTLRKISIPIQPNERIVGSVLEIIPSKDQIDQVETMTDAWWDIPIEEIQKKILWFYSYNWLRRRPPWFHSFGHLGLNWSKMLGQGIGGYTDEAREMLSRDEIQEDEFKKNFVEGAVLCYKALSMYINRWAEAVHDMASACETQALRDEYEEIAAICRNVSKNPARSFREALQLIWFIVLPLMKVCGCGVLDLGRMDQYLLPYYRHDVETGMLTREEAHDLVVEFFYKNNEIMSPADHMSLDDIKTQFTLEMTFDDPNYVIVGGLLEGNKPGVNELSHLLVEAQHSLKLRNPFMVVRHYPSIDEEFWLRTCAAMRDNATIVVYNDETMIPALKRYGIKEGDAYDYGFYGCNDPDITGKQGGLRQLWFNLALPLELVLNQQNTDLRENEPPAASQFTLEDRMIGLMKGSYRGIKTKSLDEIASVDDLLNEYRRQLRFILCDYRYTIDRDVVLEKQYNRGRIRIEDCFMEGPMENALTWNDGGILYNVMTVQGSGIATVVDSLAAIEKLVYQDKEMSLLQLSEVLHDNFEGQEVLRSRLINRFPKFGNDIQIVDELASRIAHIFCDEVARQNEGEHLYLFLPTLSTDRDFTGMGRIINATPDGRRAGEPISENQSPTTGMDTNGLTALLNSVSHIPFEKFTGGPLNLKIHPTAVQGGDGLKALAALLKAFLEHGGMQVQINVVSKEELLDAQIHPEKHQGLCIRVTGYSAYFTQMGRKAQDEVVCRTEQL